MNTFFILLIPVFGLFTIMRGGRWHWDPIGPGGPAFLQTPFLHRLLVVMFWVGWTLGLIVVALMLFGLWPTSR